MVFPFRFPEQKLCIFHFLMHATYPSYVYVATVVTPKDKSGTTAAELLPYGAGGT